MILIFIYSIAIYFHKPIHSTTASRYYSFTHSIKICRICTVSSSESLASVLACSSSELTCEAMNILDNSKYALGSG